MATAEKRDILAFAWGDVAHPVRSLKVNEQFYEDYREGFEKLAAEGYYAPVVQQHWPDVDEDDDPRQLDSGQVDPDEGIVDDGFLYGLIADVGRNDEGILWQLQVVDRVAQAIDEGGIAYWSPGLRFEWPHPNTREVLKLAPKHAAFVTTPHQKNIEPQSDFYDLEEQALRETYSRHSTGLILQESAMGDNNSNEPESNDTNQQGGDGAGESDLQEGEGMKAVREELAGLKKMVEKLVGQMSGGETNDGGDGSGDGDGGESSELAEYKRRVKQLENRQVRNRVKDLGVDDQETIEEIVELAETDRVEAFDKLADKVREAQKQGGSQLLGEAGATGTAPSGNGADPSRSQGEALELAEQQLSGTDAYDEASAAERSKMKVRKARELRGEV